MTSFSPLLAATTSGDYGGDPFSRRAQMGADDEGKEPIADDNDEGYKTGTSTPGYRHPDGERSKHLDRLILEELY